MRKVLLTKRCLIIIAAMVYGVSTTAQVILSPNYGLKSPSTAELLSVDFRDDATVISLSITSDINNAYFCIEKNTFLVKPDGSKVKLEDVKGLPNCPSTYRFKRPGETKRFVMTFPATGLLPWFSIVEECPGGCFSFYGIVTDSELNQRLAEAYSFSDKGQAMAAYDIFSEIIEEIDSLNLGIEGALFSSLIILERKMGRYDRARAWYTRMMTSDTPDLKKYLENLKQQGVDY